MEKMRTGLAMLMLAGGLCSTVQAVDTQRGKKLHQQHCQRCHQDEVYTRAERIVENFPALRERVSQCELSNNLLWFDEEIDDVTGFLNREYYEFGVK